METLNVKQHRGPNPGILAIVFAILFCTGLSFVVSFSNNLPHFPGPWEPASAIVLYFQNRAHDVLLCSFFQFCSAIPLGIFTATMVSRISFLGSTAAGNNIAWFGGLFTTFNVGISSMVGWVMAYPQIAADEHIVRTLYYISFAIGGVGYSVPLGLLIAGISVQSWFMKTLPKWLIIFGIALAVIGELSSLNLLFPQLIYLIPLTRFPGFIWLILAGFKMPKVNSLSNRK
jgi:hypothetical protein